MQKHCLWKKSILICELLFNSKSFGIIIYSQNIANFLDVLF